MAKETLVAVYDTAAQAAAVVQDLHAANVPSGAISSHAASSGAAGGTSWSSLFGGQPEHDTAVYDRSVEAGSTVVTVRTPDEHVESVSRILEQHNPIDIDGRASGYGLGKAAAASTTTTATTAAVGGAPVAGAGEQAIQLAEEQLVVGKRLVDRGTTRVRRFVVETPVEENVTLRAEHVSIQRKPGSGAVVTDADFTDRVIEVSETVEEIVVSKTARVREEVVIRKDIEDRVETIRDTVRREDVEITRDDAAHTARAVSTTGSDLPASGTLPSTPTRT
jgi:uncharacterized protein (TIGR02271 family)